MRQSHIDDRGIQDLHESGGGHGEGDRPGIGPRPPIRPPAVGIDGTFAHFSSTSGSADKPSGKGRFGSRPRSIRILTGTRWTILTKLPVAFSAGKVVKREPEPIWMLST